MFGAWLHLVWEEDREGCRTNEESIGFREGKDAWMKKWWGLFCHLCTFGESSVRVVRMLWTNTTRRKGRHCKVAIEALGNTIAEHNTAIEERLKDVLDREDYAILKTALGQKAEYGADFESLEGRVN